MSVKIQGTVKQKSGGGGLGSLLGKIVGGSAGFLIGGPAGALAGAGIGGGLGGAAGNMVDPAKQNDIGIPIDGAKDSAIAQQAPKTSAIDRINKMFDIGTTVYGGATALNSLKAPKIGGASTAIDRRMLRMG